jgi:hypothetical protein
MKQKMKQDIVLGKCVNVKYDNALAEITEITEITESM